MVMRVAHVVQGEMKVGFRGAFSLVRFFCASQTKFIHTIEKQLNMDKRNERPRQGALTPLC